MKIICSHCKKIIGEQAPYKDFSEVKAKCTDCLEKEKEAAPRFKPSPEVKDGQEVTLESGAKGRLWAAKSKLEKLSLWDLAVSGKKFYCSDKTREQFQKYLNGVKNDEVDVTFLHSVTCKMDLPPRGRKKKEEIPKVEKKTEDIQYNCTVKVNKKFAQSMFEGMVDRLNKVLDILMQADLRRAEELLQKKRDAVKETV